MDTEQPTKPKKPKKEKKAHGRPLAYQPEYDEQARRLCMLLNVTDDRIAKFFGITTKTLYEWKNRFPSFSEAIKEGKEHTDLNIANSLYERAIGYSHPEEKIFCYEGEIIRTTTIKHYPPEPKCLELWLANRQNYLRNPKVIQVDPGNAPITINISDARTPDADRNKLD